MTASNEASTVTCPFTERNAVNLAEASLSDPVIQAHPRDFYWSMRQQDPVHYDEQLGMWLVTRYEDIVTVLRDPITYSDKMGYEALYASGFFEEFKAILEEHGGGFFPDAIKSDPPYHTRIRKLMDGAFSAHRVKSLEPGITKIIASLAEDIVAKGVSGETVDGFREFAIPLTISVICEQLGIEQYNGKKISRWSEAITAQIGCMQDREQMIENAREICELQNFIIAQMKDRQAAPKEDMISDLVHAELDDGSKLTFAEAVSLVRALIIAGNDTTATAITNLLFLFATRPSLMDDLYQHRDDDRYLNRFVEELLRYAPPVRGLAKMTIEETELGGQKLPKGAHLLVMYASGNDDENKFACPREFDMTRNNLGTHVAFGAGVHRCIGASLAKMEIKVAAVELVKRIAKINLTVAPEELTYLPTVATHAIGRLPITFEKR